MSGNGKNLPSTSQSTDEEQVTTKCWVCGQDISPDKSDVDQATQIALVVINGFLLSHFGEYVKLQELNSLYTKEGQLKGWMTVLMAVIPHQDEKHRVLGRTESLHDIGKIMFGFDYQVVPDRSTSYNELVANLKRARRIKAKSTPKQIRKSVARQRAKMRGGVMSGE